MEFGLVEKQVLDQIDFTLPPDHLQTTTVLSTNYSATTKTKFYVGCAKWGRADWVGKIYPKGTKAANFLDEYAKQFNCIEFNAIYYRLPSLHQVALWRKKVPIDFKFCPKFQEEITHTKRLKDIERELAVFLEVLYAFGNNLGPVFFMPHPQMSAKQAQLILDFLLKLPADIEVFTEFRHPEWFLSPNFEKAFNTLEQLNRGSVITDSAGRRDCVHMRLTTPDAFIRFVGNSLHASDYIRIDDWVKRIHQWQQSGLKNCYFFMHQHDEEYSPELIKYFIEELNKVCLSCLKEPRFVNERELF